VPKIFKHIFKYPLSTFFFMQFKSLYDTPRKRGALALFSIIVISILAYLALSQPYVELGDEVVFHFTIGLSDGTVIGTTDANEAKIAKIFDSNVTYNPINLIVGTGIASKTGLLPIEVEEALLGMKVGERKVIKAYAPYGYYDSNKIMKLTIDEYKSQTGQNPEISSKYILIGNRIYGKMTDVKEGYVYIDINNQYAVPLRYLQKVPIEKIVELGITPKKGMEITYEKKNAYIFDVSEKEVGLDYYPPFLFRIKIVSIRKNVTLL